MVIFAKRALLGSHWVKQVRLRLDSGRIDTVECGVEPLSGDIVVDCLLPAQGNLHSHVFQRAMAGMTEVRAKGKDSFWTWRELMYQFVGKINPEQYEAIAALVYMEMLECGYSSVGEFHYLHHQVGGAPYSNMAETSERVMAAAALTGIGLTHLPVLYTYGGAGKKAMSSQQMRFNNSVSSYLTLIDSANTAIASLPEDCVLGIAPHSLRATCPDDLQALLAAVPTGPKHIHIAEQPQEVRDISAWLGARPVEWLLDNVSVDQHWCLVHATHLTDQECTNMARSGAVAGLCPITEANLGDGPFNGPLFIQEGGVFGVGSDSNVRISLTEELRMLEYSQRLRDLARNVFIDGDGSVGDYIYRQAAAGSAQALGREAGEIKEGQWADLVSIDTGSAALCALRDDQLLDGLVFAAQDNVVRDVWSAGRHVVKDGKHIAREAILSNYRTATEQLLAK